MANGDTDDGRKGTPSDKADPSLNGETSPEQDASPKDIPNAQSVIPPVVQDDTPLTKNEQLVLDVLQKNDGPMKAYELLAELKDKGVKAPMTIYRALDRLEARGLIHKLDGINAFMICNHDHPHSVQIFLICTNCSKAEEIVEHGVTSFDWAAAVGLATPHGFKAQSARIEVRGFCSDCD